MAPAASPAPGDLPLDRQPDPLAGPWKVGPVRLDPFVKIEQFGWDSNVFLSDRGKEQSDLMMRLSAGIRGQMLFGSRGSLSFEEKPDYVAFAHTSSQSYANNRLSGRADLVAGRLSLATGGQWNTSRDWASSEFDERSRTTTRTAFAGLAWRTHSRTSVTVTTGRLWLGVSDSDQPDIGALLDRTEARLAERFSWRAAPRTTLFTEHSSLRIAFDDTPGRDSRVQSWTAGARLEGRGAVTGSVQLGPARLTSDDPRWSGDNALLGEADVAVRAGETWLLLAGGRRALLFAVFENNLFYREDRLNASARKALTPRLALEAGAEWTWLRWPGRDESPLVTGSGTIPACAASGLPCSELRQDRIVSRFVGVRFKVARRSELTARLSLRRRTSNLPGEDDEQVVFTTGAGF
jgi:hypothetical protein